MKKALDYVSDYQLKSASKDAICIAPSKVTQMIFAVLEDWYHITYLMAHFRKLSHRCKKHLADISSRSRVIAIFVSNFVVMAPGVGQKKMRLAAFDGPSPKTPYRRKISPKALTQAEL